MRIMKNLNLVFALLLGTGILASCKKDDGGEVVIVEENNTESLANTFFEKVSYKGAFGTSDWTSGWANFNPKNVDYSAGTDTLKGSITSNVTLNASKVYILKGFVYVKSGAILTIPAGTVIRGDKTSKATLVVTKGGKLMAEGTASKPIIFTSNLDKASRGPGDWGGIILLGKSANNIAGGSGLIEGGVDDGAGAGGHGGTEVADNSGILKYVRIEFPGIAYQPNNEVNGLTFGSVGSGTVIDYVQVSYSGDDSFEWFGGTVNCKHLISIANTDDIFDFDNGFVGKLQFLLGQRDPMLADAGGASNGIESDNAEKVFNSTPRTRPIISNMTLVGPGSGLSVNVKHEYANLWRRGSKMILANSIFVGFRYGLDIRDKETGDALVDKSSTIKNNIYQSYIAGKDIIADGATLSFATSAELLTYFNTNGNTQLADETAAKGLFAGDIFSLTAPSFVLKSGSAAAAGASF